MEKLGALELTILQNLYVVSWGAPDFLVDLGVLRYPVGMNALDGLNPQDAADALSCLDAADALGVLDCLVLPDALDVLNTLDALGGLEVSAGLDIGNVLYDLTGLGTWDHLHGPGDLDVVFACPWEACLTEPLSLQPESQPLLSALPLLLHHFLQMVSSCSTSSNIFVFSSTE